MPPHAAGDATSSSPIRPVTDPLSAPAVVPIPVTRFTTDAFAPADRHEAWTRRDWPAIGPLFETVPVGTFYNRSERFALGGIVVHHSKMAAQRYYRSAAFARRDGFDGLIAEILLSGETRGVAAGRSTHNAPGGMVFNDLAQEHDHVSTDAETLLLSIPRHLAECNGLDPAALHGVRVSPTAANLVQAHLLAVQAVLPSVELTSGERLGQSLIDLIGELVIASSGAQAAENRCASVSGVGRPV